MRSVAHIRVRKGPGKKGEPLLARSLLPTAGRITRSIILTKSVTLTTITGPNSTAYDLTL
jgi:hypothetical protein